MAKNPATTFIVVKNSILVLAAILTALVAIFGVASTVYNHFATAEEVEQLEEGQELLGDRLELKIIDDEIRRQENEVHELKSYKVFQQVPNPQFTVPEKKILDSKEEKIQDLKAVRQKRFEQIEKKVNK